MPTDDTSDLFVAFDDLESQAEAAYAREREPELADRSQAAYADVTMAARLMASVGTDVVAGVIGVGPIRGCLERVASGWCRIEGDGGAWIVVTSAITTVTGASERAVPEVAWPATARLGLRSAMRRLAATGRPCVVHAIDGRRDDGVFRRVGTDFAEIVVGDPERVVLVGYAHMAAVQVLTES